MTILLHYHFGWFRRLSLPPCCPMADLPANPDELLLRLVEADEKIRPDRERFILFRVLGSGPGLPVQHPGIEEDGLHAREQDINDLADAGYLRLTIRERVVYYGGKPARRCGPPKTKDARGERASFRNRSRSRGASRSLR